MISKPPEPSWKRCTGLICRGDIDVFRQQLSIAKSDWRDTLITAGLADENWPTVLLSAGIHGFKRRGQCDAA